MNQHAIKQIAKLWHNKNYYHLDAHMPLNFFMSNLSQLRRGQQGQIESIDAEQLLIQRLAALGFRRGKVVQVIRQASFNGPLHVRIGSTDIMLRVNEARRIKLITQ